MKGSVEMTTSSIKELINCDIHKVWMIVLNVDNNDKQFIEYTKENYATKFTITIVEPYERWEFDMENSNIKGHWIGTFIADGNQTKIEFTENVIPKKWFMKPFIKSYLKKQQTQFVEDLKKALE